MFIRFTKRNVKKEREILLELAMKYRKITVNSIIAFVILIFIVGALLVVLLM